MPGICHPVQTTPPPVLSPLHPHATGLGVPNWRPVVGRGIPSSCIERVHAPPSQTPPGRQHLILQCSGLPFSRAPPQGSSMPQSSALHSLAVLDSELKPRSAPVSSFLRMPPSPHLNLLFSTQEKTWALPGPGVPLWAPVGGGWEMWGKLGEGRQDLCPTPDVLRLLVGQKKLDHGEE